MARGGIVVLDSAGNVKWTDEAWTADHDECGLPRPPIGTNFFQAYRGNQDPRAQALANGVVAVFEGKAVYFELEHRSGRESDRSFLTSVVALKGVGAGAVVINNVVDGRIPRDAPHPVDIGSMSGAPIRMDLERLTPREHEVFELMAAGLDNRDIAAKLRIQYTTVRGHVRAVIEKVRARSRLEAVARAYRNGWVANQ